MFCLLLGAAALAGAEGVRPAPDMVRIPGGDFWMGSDHAGMDDSQPVHRVHVDAFWIDRTEVTNDQFAAFVAATGYITVAERRPDPKDFPGAKPADLVPGSVVFTPPQHAVELTDAYVWWRYVKGANWKHPEGPSSDLKGRGKHPVVHVAWEDAAAYAKWAGRRLPTEAEFEFAARGGLDRQPFVWGKEFRPGGRFQANTFQGHFPDTNTAEDGYTGTAPVGSFPANGYGLYDMAGNVWSGAPTGTAPTITSRSRNRALSFATRKARRIASTRTNPASRNACSGADRSSAPINTVHATCPAAAAKAKPAPGPIM